MKFSVLMSIYHKEKPEYFNRAMLSIWDEQTIKPNEIVLVQDGPLTEQLYKSIDLWKEKLGGILKTISLEKNVGLGNALNIGIKNCTYELIARMDTDDISLPNRFEKQLKIFENSDIDVCSAWISEFEYDENHIISYRKIPEDNEQIIKYGKFRSPVNHIPVMYKKSAVEKAGNYGEFRFAQDYHLWARMIVNGAKFYNIQEPLANIRAGYGQLERRSGLAYAKNELNLLKEFKKIGFLNNYEFARNVAIRFTARILPKSLIKMIYKKLRN
jgi:glycosyltransferase involved in cell wall biosynthesis